jgi:hypothetical protein
MQADINATSNSLTALSLNSLVVQLFDGVVKALALDTIVRNCQIMSGDENCHLLGLPPM